jgi:hypothetical protein
VGKEIIFHRLEILTGPLQEALKRNQACRDLQQDNKLVKDKVLLHLVLMKDHRTLELNKVLLPLLVRTLNKQ